MMNSLNWLVKDNILVFQGVLTRDSLMDFWQQKPTMNFANIETIDVSAVERVDSAGLGLLVDLVNSRLPQKITLSGISNELSLLINVYNLNQVFIQ